MFNLFLVLFLGIIMSYGFATSIDNCYDESEQFICNVVMISVAFALGCLLTCWIIY